MPGFNDANAVSNRLQIPVNSTNPNFRELAANSASLRVSGFRGNVSGAYLSNSDQLPIANDRGMSQFKHPRYNRTFPRFLWPASSTTKRRRWRACGPATKCAMLARTGRFWQPGEMDSSVLRVHQAFAWSSALALPNDEDQERDDNYDAGYNNYCEHGCCSIFLM